MKLIDADDIMERIEQAYEDMGVDTHGVWNKQLAEIFKTADVEDIRQCLHKILGAVAQSPRIDRPQGEWIKHKEKTEINGKFIDFFPAEYECSNCGLREAHYFINSKPHNFCPNCGAYMKGADDE